MTNKRPMEQHLRDALSPFALRLVVLFGSWARDEARPDSDLDVAVLAHKPLSARDRVEIIGALALVSDRPVDLVDLRDVGEPLLGRILSEGRRLSGQASEWGSLLSRHLIDQEDFVPLQNRILKTRREAWIRQ